MRKKLEGGGVPRPSSNQPKPKTQFDFSKLPKDPQQLLKNGWKDVTHPELKRNTSSREYYDPKSGLRVRFDKKREGAPGFEGKDHYHIFNPNSTSNRDLYLDVNGNPVSKGSNASHILPGGQ
ncbi:hypothetical protein [Brevibacillus daliensis]|uniref:hypothetical protein n=1 Tax=Brevibacillus daliensis TaxID=2892995 RepID=UPI001E3CEA74|nr:hypothetical protein [Brevibacillus daliensis]